MPSFIPIGPTSRGKDGSWRGGSALVGIWTLALLFGALTPLPTIVWGRGTLASILDVVLLIGLVMSVPYASRWLTGKKAKENDVAHRGSILFEAVNPVDGSVVNRVYHPEKSGSWTPPLNKGISRSLDTRMTIWRELSWVAPVTFGDIVLTTLWNAVLLLTGRVNNRRDPRPGDGEGLDYGDEELA